MRVTFVSRSIARTLAFAVALLLPCAGHAQANSPAETCLAVNSDLSLGASLPRTASIMKAHQPLKVVAIGSSSTVGLWQMDSAKTYPGRMKAEIARLDPAARIEIVNSGRNGDTISGNIARFERDVFAHHPDLIIWQLGSNDLTWGESGESLETKISDAVKTLRASGADVILMDQQYTPVIIATSYGKMQSAIANVAKHDGVPLLPRFEMLHKTADAGVSLSSLSAFDGLHMSGEAYDCVGRALARAIIAAVK
jgi:lysophospholipase L1-like esterase